MKRIVLISVFLILGNIEGYSQVINSQASSGSVYSNIGVGIPVDLSSSSAEGIGVPGVSFFDGNVAGLANPAHWGSTVLSLATGGVSLRNFDAKDSFGDSQNTILAVNYFQLQLPITKDKLGISLSLAPLTNTSYRIVSTDTRIIDTGGTVDSLIAETENRGSGGINNLELGVGWKINDYISIGYAGSLVFASLDNNVETTFLNDVDNRFQNLNFTLETSGVAIGNRFGTFITVPGIFNDSDKLNIGATVNLPVRIAAERVQEADKLTNNRIVSVVIEEGPGLGDGDIRLPLKISGGLTYQPGRLLSIVTEGLYEQWSDSEFDFNRNQERMLENRVKLGGGIRYFPFLTRSDKFLSKFKYRAGISYDTGHLKINGEKIETLLFSTGLGILSPNRNSNSSIDISFHYGIRGTRDMGLVKENIWGIQLSINLAEIMFFRPKLQ